MDLFYELANEGGAFRFGQKVGVSIPLRDSEDSLVVPWSAVTHDVNGGTWVYENTASDKFVRRRVEVTRVMGADAILLIAACLDDAQMRDMEAIARDLYMAVLVEVHDAAELARALKLQTRLLGINNRNLRSFEVSLDTTITLKALVPDDKLLITESGITERADVKRMNDAGVHGFLVGEAFMRAPDPGAAMAELFAPDGVAGR